MIRKKAHEGLFCFVLFSCLYAYLSVCLVARMLILFVSFVWCLFICLSACQVMASLLFYLVAFSLALPPSLHGFYCLNVHQSICEFVCLWLWLCCFDATPNRQIQLVKNQLVKNQLAKNTKYVNSSKVKLVKWSNWSNDISS